MSESVVEAPKEEIVCRAHITPEVIRSLRTLYGKDLRGSLVMAVFETIIEQAALQSKKHSGLSIEDVQRIVRKVNLDNIAERFGEIARKCPT